MHNKMTISYRLPECDQIRQRIFRITSTEAVQIPDSLRMILELTASVRGCEGDDRPAEREAWLLNNEVFALEGLEQYDGAFGIVDRFFSTYFDEASNYYRACFYLWRLHLSALSGTGVSMVKDYAETQKYAPALDRINLAWLHINGAYAYRNIREYETAFALTQEAKALLPNPQTYEDSVALARAMHMEAEVQFLRLMNLSQAIEDLRVAATLYGTLGDTSQVAAITTLLGQTYAAEGDTSLALSEMETSVLLARKSGSVRNETYALFRQGQLLRRWGDLETAKQVLKQALDESEIVQEFLLRIAYELALLYEEWDELDRAASYYQAVIDAPRPRDFMAALEAERKQQEAQIRLLLIESHRHQTRFYFALSGLLMVLVGGGVFFLFLKRRRSPEPSLVEKKSNGVFIPRKMPTGLSLEALEQRFVQAIDALKLGRRLAWVYAVLLDTALILPFIHDEYLARQVEAYDVENNTALFQCVASVEEARTGESFSGRAENTLASYLRGEFERRGWDWPKNPLAWKLFFTKYHVDTLF